MSKFDKKVQKEVSQIANCKLSRATAIGGLSVNLNHLKTQQPAHLTQRSLFCEALNTTDEKAEHLLVT